MNNCCPSNWLQTKITTFGDIWSSRLPFLPFQWANAFRLVAYKVRPVFQATLRMYRVVCRAGHLVA